MESMARGHWDEWMWTARNGVAVLAALVLAGILSQVRVFQEAVLGSDGFNAAAVVRLLGYGIALALIWITAWRAAAQIPPRDTVSRLLHEGLPPFATLLILPGVYGLIRPFLNERAVTGVSWMFVLLLLATAVWLGRVLYANAEALVIGAAAIGRRVSESAERRTHACQNCGAPNSATAKFCTSCGASLEQPTSRDDKLTVVSENERSSTELRRSA
jgi:hypothetical protein